MKIALTGGIACGKSTLAAILREFGVSLLDADDVVHELEGPGGAAVGPILKRFPGVAAGRIIKNEELRIKNEELRIKNEELRIKDEELRINNEELRIKNEELRIKNCHCEADGMQHRHCAERNARSAERDVAIFCESGAASSVNGQSIDRKKLAQIVFSDPAARKDLESILFPMVRERLLAFADGGDEITKLRNYEITENRNYEITKLRNFETTAHQSPIINHQSPITNSEFKISVIPLLFESHWESDYDIILAIASSEEKQIERMMVTRGYTRDHAKARLAAQMPIAEKIRRADYVITNDSTPEHLRDQAGRLLVWLKERKKYEH